MKIKTTQIENMKQCPKDCNEAYHMCNKISKDGWLCTRKKNHKGKHHAHGSDEKCFKTWSSA